MPRRMTRRRMVRRAARRGATMGLLRRAIVEPAEGRQAGVPVMQAAIIERFGPPRRLVLGEVPRPKPGPSQVLIRLSSAGVGGWDAEMRSGWWPEGKPDFPVVLGSDGAGVVVDRGARVRERFAPGDRVWAFAFPPKPYGFYAEYAAVDAKNVGFVPTGLDLEAAGAVPATGLTALQGIDDRLRVRPGEAVLIFGATGAVGTLAVQFAKRKRATVIATSRSATGVRLLKKLGADLVLDPDSPRALELLGHFAPDGLDAVLALASGPGLEKLLGRLKPRGRFAAPNGVEGLRGARRYDALGGTQRFERLARAAVEAELQVPLAGRFPLSQAAKAHALVERGHLLGRVVLVIGQSAQQRKPVE